MTRTGPSVVAALAFLMQAIPTSAQDIVDRMTRGVVQLLSDAARDGRCDDCSGLTNVSGRIWIEDASDGDRIVSLVQEAGRAMVSIFGEVRADPMFVVCSTEACNDRFNVLDAYGKAYGPYRIVVSSTGSDLETLVHERVHTEVSARIGITRTMDVALPIWFEEGVAVYFSHGEYPWDPSADLRWIMDTATPQGWDDACELRGVSVAYGTAGETVHRIGSRIGTAGLVAVVDRVGRGESFESALDAEMTKVRP